MSPHLQTKAGVGGLADPGPRQPRVLEARRRDASRVSARYSQIAPIYEVWAHLTESRARRRVLELAAAQDGEVVLEVATGTGVQLLALARQNPSGRTLGVELAAGMLRPRPEPRQAAPAASNPPPACSARHTAASPPPASTSTRSISTGPTPSHCP